MSEQTPADFTRLPAEVPADEMVAYQLGEEAERFGGPGGGGDAVDGDSD